MEGDDLVNHDQFIPYKLILKCFILGKGAVGNYFQVQTSQMERICNVVELIAMWKKG